MRGGGIQRPITPDEQASGAADVARVAAETAMQARADAAAAHAAAQQAHEAARSIIATATTAAADAHEAFAKVMDVAMQFHARADEAAEQHAAIDRINRAFEEHAGTIEANAECAVEAHANASKVLRATRETLAEANEASATAIESALVAEARAQGAAQATEKAQRHEDEAGRHAQAVLSAVGRIAAMEIKIDEGLTRTEAGLNEVRQIAERLTRLCAEVSQATAGANAMLLALTKVQDRITEAANRTEDAALEVRMKAEVVSASHGQIERHAQNVAEAVASTKTMVRDASESAVTAREAIREVEMHLAAGRQASAAAGELAVETARIHAQTATHAKEARTVAGNLRETHEALSVMLEKPGSHDWSIAEMSCSTSDDAMVAAFNTPAEIPNVWIGTVETTILATSEDGKVALYRMSNAIVKMDGGKPRFIGRPNAAELVSADDGLAIEQAIILASFDMDNLVLHIMNAPKGVKVGWRASFTAKSGA